MSLKLLHRPSSRPPKGRLQGTAYGIEAPGPVPAEATDPSPETEAPPAAAAHYTIAIRLVNGDLIKAGETEGSDKAVALGHAVVADLRSEDGLWPFFGGRYINPEAIVSVDLLSEESQS
jgi:hypothetical protein